MTPRRSLLLLCGLMAVLSACTSSAGSSASTVPAPASEPVTTVPGLFGSLPLGGPACDPPSPFVVSEVRGTAGSAQLYGLVIAKQPIRVGAPVKIVWRMTGTGDLVVAATAPSGHDLPLTFGPEKHGGSTYDRPGDEWGTGYTFPEPGCWTLHLQRDDARGDVWLIVDP